MSETEEPTAFPRHASVGFLDIGFPSRQSHSPFVLLFHFSWQSEYGYGYGVWGPLLVFGATNKLSCPPLTTKPCGYPKLGMTAKEGLHTQRKTERNMYNKKEDENCVGRKKSSQPCNLCYRGSHGLCGFHQSIQWMIQRNRIPP